MIESTPRLPGLAFTAEHVEALMACLRAGTPVPAPLVERLVLTLHDLENEYRITAHEVGAYRPFALHGATLQNARREGGLKRGAQTPGYQGIADEYWQKHPNASKLDAARWVRRRLSENHGIKRSLSTIRDKINKK